ncbi:MAG: hypothetical protein LBM03_00880 [Erysipelotrichaceae bacterium]|jgi:M6 family metalloprotease-like protein|nr:hypothetical protein [Erysipelotrichaceae bacterium]
MNKQFSFIIKLSLFPLILSSCGFDYSFVPYVNYKSEILTKRNMDNNVFFSSSEYATLPYETYDKENKVISSYRDLFDSRVKKDTRPYLNMSGLGEQNLLVIPVSFSDSNKDDQNVKLDKISNVFFGIENKTTYESVASFYNKSSYGHLKLKGKVSDWFELDMTANEVKTKIQSNTYGSRYVASKALEWYSSNFSDLEDFDMDQDGYIDGIFIIYDTPYVKKDNLYWAYTDRMKKDDVFQPISGNALTLNKGNPAINGYSWASIDFMNVGSNYVDSHVYSHETGHLFGLLDYYSSEAYQPTGYMDMMDYNIGDHTGWSKMLLDWVTPYVLKDHGEITIRPFEDEGELILIPNGEWNGTPYDEFLLLEFYSPTHLNKYDTKLRFSYEENGSVKTGSLFTDYGLKVYHVDARIGYYNDKTLHNLICELDDPLAETKLDWYREQSTTEDFYISFINDNTIKKASENPIYHLLERSGNNTFINGTPANNGTLFQEGDSFGINTFRDFTFNNGNNLKYTFEILSLSNNGATIRFNKIAD